MVMEWRAVTRDERASQTMPRVLRGVKKLVVTGAQERRMWNTPR